MILQETTIGNLFDSSSSEDEDDPANKIAIPMKSIGDYQVTVQYSETSSDSESSSYACEETRT